MSTGRCRKFILLPKIRGSSWPYMSGAKQVGMLRHLCEQAFSYRARLNYILWIQDLLLATSHPTSETVIGIDM